VGPQDRQASDDAVRGTAWQKTAADGAGSTVEWEKGRPTGPVQLLSGVSAHKS
jgi:hypothetical protein